MSLSELAGTFSCGHSLWVSKFDHLEFYVGGSGGVYYAILSWLAGKEED